MRAPAYGELQIHKANTPVRGLWYSRHEEPPPVEFYQLCDREWQDPTEHERSLDRRWLAAALMDRLTEKHHDVLFMRYVEDMTLEEIGKFYGVTSERIRQIELNAIRRIKYWARDAVRLNKVIKDYKDQQKEKLQ